jgi:serine/threonine-protein kinase
MSDLDAEEEPVPSLAVGTLIGGKYRIEQLIGRGGMGSVWSAVHTSLGQRVAVKLIAKRYAASREARHRFDLEAKAVAQLRSRYVVQVYDHGETDDGTPYIVMELLEGESLDARLARGPLPLAAAFPILEQVSRALARAHALGMVHRDLKPENVFLTVSPDGDGEIAKVLDFGIVKIRGHEGIGSSTRTGAVLGTPLYMSPEQARALKTVDQRTDLYSLGMVAYAMLTGQPAFSGESLGDLLVAICTEPLPQIRGIAHWLPPPMDAWFQKACAREPADRFEAASDMMTAFATAGGLRAPGAASVVPAAQSVVAPAPQSTAPPVAVEGATADQTAAPFSVTEDSIPKRGVAVPVVVAAGVVALAGALVVTRLVRTSPEVPPAEPVTAAPASAPATPNTTAETTTAVVEQKPPPARPAPAEAPKGAPKAPEVVTTSPHVTVSPTAPKPNPPLGTAKPTPAKPPGAAPVAAKPPKAAKPGSVDLGF